METRASYVLVGSFVLGLVAAAVVFVLWIANTGSTSARSYHVLFTGNVTGLATGASVRYRGIHKGEVGAIKVRAPTPYEVETFKVHDEIIDVEIKVASDTPVFTDTVASLEAQGLTGSPFVQLKRKLVADAVALDTLPSEKRVITGESSGLEKIFEEFPKAIASITELANRASALLDKDNQEYFKATLKGASEALTAIRDFANEGQTIVREARAPVAELSNLAKRGQQSLGELEKGVQSFSGLMGDLRGVVKENRRPIADFAATGLYELSLFLTDMRKFVRTFDRILIRVESDPSQFLFGNSQRGFETRGGQR